MKPRFKHYCQNCIFIGFDEDKDVWYCPSPHEGTIILRKSDEGSDYASADLSIARKSPSKMFDNALRLLDTIPNPILKSEADKMTEIVRYGYTFLEKLRTKTCNITEIFSDDNSEFMDWLDSLILHDLTFITKIVVDENGATVETTTLKTNSHHFNFTKGR